MKAGRSNTENSRLVLKGRVVKRKAGAGTKSEHDAVYIESTKGSYQLRKIGANPFQNDELDKLVGRELTVEGFVQDYIFYVQRVIT